MLNILVNYIVKSHLSDYLDIDVTKTNTGITSGKYVLENIKIKKDVFQKLNLPFFEIKNSFIGKISIELTKLATFHPEDYPIILIIEDIFVNIEQKGINDWEEHKKLKELQNAKNNFLKNIEEFYSNYLQTKSDSDNHKSSDFVKKIVNNLNIVIKNVIIRIEDDISYPSNPYCLAIAIKTLETKPNKDFQNQFKIHDSQAENIVIQKIITLDDFSFYMDVTENNIQNDYYKKINDKGWQKAELLNYYFQNDQEGKNWYAYCHSELEGYLKDPYSHNYILHNLDFTFKVIFNQDYLINKEEFIKAELSIKNIMFNLTLLQLKVLIKVSAYISVIQTSYYIQIEETYFKNEMDSETADKYITKYIEYFEKKYFLKKDESEYSDDKLTLETLESCYKFDYLQKIRYLTYEKLKFLSREYALQKKIEEKTPGYLTGIFSSNETLIEIEQLKIEKNEHSKIKLEIEKKLRNYIENINNDEFINKEIEDEKNLAKEKEMNSLSNDYIKIWLKLAIENFVIAVRTEKIYVKSRNDFEEEKKQRNVNKNKKNSFDYDDNLCNENFTIDYKNIFDKEFDNNYKKDYVRKERISKLSLENNEQNNNLQEEKEKYLDDLLIIKFKNLETLILLSLEKTQLYLFLGDIVLLQNISKHRLFNKILESHYDKNLDDIDNSLFQNESPISVNQNIILTRINMDAGDNTNEIKTEIKKEKSFCNIEPSKTKEYNLEDKNSSNKYEREFDLKCGALLISFEINPELPNSNMRMRIRNSKRLYIYLNMYSLQLLGFLLSEVLKSEMDFDEIAKNTSKKSLDNIKKGYSKMHRQVVQGEYKPFAIHTDIVLKSPRIIFPQDITNNQNKDCFFISMGEFTVKSHLANRIPNQNVINVRTLKYYDNLFDNYDINISNFEAKVIYDFDNLKNLNKNLIEEENVRMFNKIMPIINKLNTNIIFSQLIEPKNIYNEKFKIGIKIEEFNFNLNESLVEFIANTLYYYNYFTIFYEIQINVIKNDPVFKGLTNAKNKSKFDNNINSNNIDSVLNKNIKKENNKKEKNEFEQLQKINNIDEEIRLKAKSKKPNKINNNTFIDNMQNKLNDLDEIDKQKKYELEKLSEIRES